MPLLKERQAAKVLAALSTSSAAVATQLVDRFMTMKAASLKGP